MLTMHMTETYSAILLSDKEKSLRESFIVTYKDFLQVKRWWW